MNRKPYLTIDDAGRLTCDLGDAEAVVITSVAQLARLTPAGAQCSSTVDFPEEYTADPAVIALCRALRG
jgi:hypothetical protein